MSFTNRISRTLHDEHSATVALMERLGQLLRRYPRGIPPDANELGVTQFLSELSTCVNAEIQRHFTFEEQYLFTFLDAIGEGAIGAHLTDDHIAMRPLTLRIAALAREAAAQGFNQTSWGEFVRLGRELCERILPHIEKEEMALLPLLEENMDADTEARLCQEYAESV